MMQTWARLYLSIAAIEQASLALVLITHPGTILLPTNRFVDEGESTVIFGLAFVVVALAQAIAAALGRVQLAHWALVGSALVLFAGAAGLFSGNLLDEQPSLLSALLWASLAGKDLVVTRAPLAQVMYPRSDADVVGLRDSE
jgi:hypothetical protein